MRAFPMIPVLTLTVLLIAMPTAYAQGQNALDGAWELVEATNADGNAVESTGMLIFSVGHYSWIRIFDSGRPSYSSQDEATDAQKVAAFNSFGSNAGSYTVSGSTLTRDPAAAKNPYVYAPDNRIVSTYAIDGRTLTLTNMNGVEMYTRLD